MNPLPQMGDVSTKNLSPDRVEHQGRGQFLVNTSPLSNGLCSKYYLDRVMRSMFTGATLRAGHFPIFLLAPQGSFANTRKTLAPSSRKNSPISLMSVSLFLG